MTTQSHKAAERTRALTLAAMSLGFGVATKSGKRPDPSAPHFVVARRVTKLTNAPRRRHGAQRVSAKPLRVAFALHRQGDNRVGENVLVVDRLLFRAERMQGLLKRDAHRGDGVGIKGLIAKEWHRITRTAGAAQCLAAPTYAFGRLVDEAPFLALLARWARRAAARQFSAPFALAKEAAHLRAAKRYKRSFLDAPRER